MTFLPRFIAMNVVLQIIFCRYKKITFEKLIYSLHIYDQLSPPSNLFEIISFLRNTVLKEDVTNINHSKK